MVKSRMNLTNNGEKFVRLTLSRDDAIKDVAQGKLYRRAVFGFILETIKHIQQPEDLSRADWRELACDCNNM